MAAQQLVTHVQAAASYILGLQDDRRAAAVSAQISFTGRAIARVVERLLV